MKLKLTWLLTLFMAFVMQFSFAQEKTVTGTVTTASDGLPLPGASVIVKGTTKGAQTDFDGKYTIKVNTGDVLVVSYVGMTPSEITVGTASVYDVSLEEGNTLDEVVIVGYGIKETETQKTGAYTRVGSEEVSGVPVVSLDQALQGRVAGLNITAASGQPGAAAPVFLRGVSSLSADTNPLYVINGVPVLSGDNSAASASSNPLANINPNDIESVSVLKDAMATSIYGSRGANGVIVITTKKGSAGQSSFSLTSEYGYAGIAFEEFDWLSASEHVDLVALGILNSGLASDAAAANAAAANFLNWDGETNTDWRKATRNDSPVVQNFNLSYQGGSDNFQLFSSLGYFEQEGISREAGFNRVTGNLNANWKASDRLNIAFNIGLTSSKQTGESDASSFRNPVFTGNILSPVNPIYESDGSFNIDDLTYLNPTFNPVAIQETDKVISRFYKALANINVTYDVVEDWLTLNSLFGVDYNFFDEITFWNPDFADGLNPGDPNGNGNGFKDNRVRSVWTWQNTLSLNRVFNDVHAVTATIGTEAIEDRINTTSASAQGYASGRYNLYQLANAANPTGASSTFSNATFFGLFSRASYTYDDRYSLTGSFRRDGSSRFGTSNKYGNFWAYGGTWNISNESFMDSVDFINNLKLRASYGTTGNASVGNHVAKPLIGNGDYLNQNASIISNPGNQDLTWEIKKTTNIGLDFGMFSNRVTGSIDLYKNESEELLFSAPATPSAGFSSLFRNIGTTENRGVEVQLTLKPFVGDFKWTINNTFSYNENEVTKITDESNEILASGVKNFAVGRDPSEFYTRLWAGVNPADGTPLWYTDSSRSQVTGNVNEAQLSFTGQRALPTFLASMGHTFEYKNFRLNMFFNFAGGHSVYDRWAFVYDNDGRFANLNHLASNLYDSWTPDNRSASRPQYLFNTDNNSSASNSTRYIYEADHIRLRTIELGYTFDDKVFKDSSFISSMYVYVRGLNLYTWVFDDDLYFDPEVASNAFGTAIEGAGVFDQTAPNLKQVLFGVNLNF